jgi:hypothetical protein
MTLRITERHYAECHILFIGFLNVIVMNVDMLSVVAPYSGPFTFCCAVHELKTI